MSEPIRLSKRLIELVGCSRREAELFIEGGWVTVDGVVVEEPQFKVAEQRVELLPGAALTPIEPVTLLLHKPVGYVSGQPEPGFKPAVTLVQPENQYKTPDTPAFHPMYLKGLAPAGRLADQRSRLKVRPARGLPPVPSLRPLPAVWWVELRLATWGNSVRCSGWRGAPSARRGAPGATACNA